ncbi:Serine-peptidase 212 [Carabus blaptoides fortunei]
MQALQVTDFWLQGRINDERPPGGIGAGVSGGVSMVRLNITMSQCIYLSLSGCEESFTSIRILLDAPAKVLRLYEHKSAVRIESLDNKEFLLRQPNVYLRPGVTVPLTFLVGYPAAGPVPQLIAFRVNDVTVCSPTFSLGLNGQLVTPAVPDESTTVASTTSRYQGTSNELMLGVMSNASGQNVEGCGTRVSNWAPLIVNGEPSSRGQWPWHGALYAGGLMALTYRCGASLVTTRHVITAAHCVTVRLHSTQPLDLDALLLYFGKTLLDRWPVSETQEAQASRITIHPAYNTSNLHNDLAVITLARPIQITNYVRPICLWFSESLSIDNLMDKMGTIVGWGRTSNGDFSNKLQHAQIPVVDTLTCIASDRLFYSRFSSPKSFCAGVPNETSACNGDSGGGMVFQDKRSGAWQLRGIVSLSAVDSVTGHCDIRRYVVFVDIALYLKWLREQITT